VHKSGREIAMSQSSETVMTLIDEVDVGNREDIMADFISEVLKGLFCMNDYESFVKVWKEKGVSRIRYPVKLLRFLITNDGKEFKYLRLVLKDNRNLDRMFHDKCLRAIEKRDYASLKRIKKRCLRIGSSDEDL
jgi:hypothetical protein